MTDDDPPRGIRTEPDEAAKWAKVGRSFSEACGYAAYVDDMTDDEAIVAGVRAALADAITLGLAGPADRAVQKPNAEDMAETICQWQNVLGSEGLAKKLIALYWRGAKAGEGTR